MNKKIKIALSEPSLWWTSTRFHHRVWDKKVETKTLCMTHWNGTRLNVILNSFFFILMNESCSIRFGLWKHNNWNVALLSFNLCEKVWSRTQDRTPCSVLQRMAKKWEWLSSIPVKLKHLRFNPPFESCYERSSNARTSCTDNREPRKRKVCIKPSILFLLRKFERYKRAPAVCPRVDPRNAVATAFQLPFIKTVKLLTRKNLCKATRQRYTCTYTCSCLFIAHAERGTVRLHRGLFRQLLLFSCRHDRTDGRAAVD